MKNIAIFVSGRLYRKYRDNWGKFIKGLENKYTIKLFFSLNLDKDNSYTSELTKSLRDYFGDSIGDIYYKEYKFPKDCIIDIKRITNLPYNEFSCFYNDNNNFKLIEQYQNDNNINFDVICKMRSEIIWTKFKDFVIDDSDKLIIRNKHMTNIKYWAHVYGNKYGNKYHMISDAFAYGNFNSMKIYCSTYDWILKQNEIYKGLYIHAFEVYLTDNILNYAFYKNVPNGSNIPNISYLEVIDKFDNNHYNIKIVYENEYKYNLVSKKIRSKDNKNVDVSKYLENVEK